MRGLFADMGWYTDGMFRKLVWLTCLVLLTAALYGVQWYFAIPKLEKVVFAVAAVASMYGLFQILVEEAIVRRIADGRMRYTVRKATSLLAIALTLVIVLRIFIPNPEALLVAYGLMGAGVAIALQDLFKNFAGSITLFLSGSFSVGDRVEINGVYGDVVDIGLFYSTLLEIREWVAGDQATGRLLSVPNGAVLSGVVKNYTKHHPFLWDEIQVVITNDSDWRAAMHILGTLAFTKTEPTIEVGRESLAHLRQQYYIDARNLEPAVYMEDHENGTQLSLRYVVEAHERRQVNHELWEEISDAFAEHPGIALAPVTFASVTPPHVSHVR